MTAWQSASVEAKLLEIQGCQKRHAEEMMRLRSELIAHAVFFESYFEMYTYIKAHTPNLEAFCVDMQDALELWFERHEREGKEIRVF